MGTGSPPVIRRMTPQRLRLTGQQIESNPSTLVSFTGSSWHKLTSKVEKREPAGEIRQPSQHERR